MYRVANLPALAALSLLSIPTGGMAAPIVATPKGRAHALLLKPLTLERLVDMNFATLGVTTGGTATIDPVSGEMTVSGGLLHLGGVATPARYAGAASKRTVVIIRLPKNPVLLRRIGGTETLSVTEFTLDGQDKKALAEQQSFTFAVGAQVSVPAGTVEGIYEGEIDITVQYP